MGWSPIGHQVDGIKGEIAEGLLEGHVCNRDPLCTKLLNIFSGIFLVPLAGLHHRLLPGINIAGVGDEIEAYIAGQGVDNANQLLLGTSDSTALLGGLGWPLLAFIPDNRSPLVDLPGPRRRRIGREHAAGNIENETDVLAGDRCAEEGQGCPGRGIFPGLKEIGTILPGGNIVFPVDSSGKVNMKHLLQGRDSS